MGRLSPTERRALALLLGAALAAAGAALAHALGVTVMSPDVLTLDFWLPPVR